MAVIFMSLWPKLYLPIRKCDLFSIALMESLVMMLLSLGPQALIALLHAQKQPDGGVSDPVWLSAPVEYLGSAPLETEEPSAFFLFLQSST